MASPTVVGSAAETAISTASLSHTVNLPAGATGNLFIAIMDKGSSAAAVSPLTGWNELLDENQANGLYIAWRTADGTEGATTTFTLTGTATRGAWIVYEIAGMANPATQAPQVGTTSSGSSTTPDPPSVSVTGGSKDILTIACFGRGGEEADDDTWVTAAPSGGFGGLLQKACGVAGTNLGGMVATATLASTTATSDPGTFTCATGAWRAQTVVVHPGAALTETPDDTVDLSDELSTELGMGRSFDDTVDLSDQLTATLAMARSFDDTIDLTDQLSAELAMGRSFADTVDLSDDVSILHVPGAPPEVVGETSAPRRIRKGRRISW